MSETTLRPQPIMDPRGPTPAPVPLAPRPPSLRGLAIAFFDNTKLDFGSYRALGPAVVRPVTLADGRPARSVEEFRRSVRGSFDTRPTGG